MWKLFCVLFLSRNYECVFFFVASLTMTLLTCLKYDSKNSKQKKKKSNSIKCKHIMNGLLIKKNLLYTEMLTLSAHVLRIEY